MEDVADDEVRIYVARTAMVDGAAARAFVTEEERQWLRSFHFDRDRHEHLVSRALVRAALARHSNIAPTSLVWRLGEHGKPALDPPVDLFFNASNHRDVVVCALARHEALGVDVEPHSRADEILEVAKTVFSTAELAALLALPIAARRHRAVTLWTAKEAYIKALGLGFSAPLLSITIDLDAVPPHVVGEPGWYLDVRDHGSARIALAVRGPSSSPRIVYADGEALIAGS